MFYCYCQLILEEFNVVECVIIDLQVKFMGKFMMIVLVIYGEWIIVLVINDIVKVYFELEIYLYFINQLVDLIYDGYDLVICLGMLEDFFYIVR